MGICAESLLAQFEQLVAGSGRLLELQVAGVLLHFLLKLADRPGQRLFVEGRVVGPGIGRHRAGIA